MTHRTIEIDRYGWYLEVFDDATERVGRWYAGDAGRASLDAVPTSKVKLYPLCSGSEIDEFDLACERRHDD